MASTAVSRMVRGGSIIEWTSSGIVAVTAAESAVNDTGRRASALGRGADLF